MSARFGPTSAVLALGLSVALSAVGFPAAASSAPSQTPDAGPDRRVSIGEAFTLEGTVTDHAPLSFWMADGNGPFEDMLVRYHSEEGITGVGPLKLVDGQGLGWPGDLVRIDDRVHVVDVGQRKIYVVDLTTGRCLAVTPQLSGQWKMIQSLAYDATHEQLFAFDPQYGRLIAIELGSGTVTTIGVPGLDGRRGVRSLAFDQGLGLLFAMDSDADELLVVDPGRGLVAGTMHLPLPEDSQMEELEFFEGELYGLLGLLEDGELVAGQLLRINTRTGGVSHVGPRVEDVSPHALLIESVPQRVSWRQLSGPAEAELDYTTLVRTPVHFSEPGTYVFELTLYLNGAKRRDRVTIDVEVTDCNGNGVHDAEEIAAGRAADRNANGVLDACEVERGFLLSFEAQPGEDWVGVSIAPRLESDPVADSESRTVRAWLADTVLVRSNRRPFVGPAHLDPRRCVPFDLRAFHPGLAGGGGTAVDGGLVGVQVVYGLWHRDERADCGISSVASRDFRLEVTL